MNWPDLILPPINLYSINFMQKDVKYQKVDKKRAVDYGDIEAKIETILKNRLK